MYELSENLISTNLSNKNYSLSFSKKPKTTDLSSLNNHAQGLTTVLILFKFSVNSSTNQIGSIFFSRYQLGFWMTRCSIIKTLFFFGLNLKILNTYHSNFFYTFCTKFLRLPSGRTSRGSLQLQARAVPFLQPHLLPKDLTSHCYQ